MGEVIDISERFKKSRQAGDQRVILKRGDDSPAVEIDPVPRLALITLSEPSQNSLKCELEGLIVTPMYDFTEVLFEFNEFAAYNFSVPIIKYDVSSLAIVIQHLCIFDDQNPLVNLNAARRNTGYMIGDIYLRYSAEESWSNINFWIFTNSWIDVLMMKGMYWAPDKK